MSDSDNWGDDFPEANDEAKAPTPSSSGGQPDDAPGPTRPKSTETRDTTPKTSPKRPDVRGGDNTEGKKKSTQKGSGAKTAAKKGATAAAGKAGGVAAAKTVGNKAGKVAGGAAKKASRVGDYAGEAAKGAKAAKKGDVTGVVDAGVRTTAKGAADVFLTPAGGAAVSVVLDTAVGKFVTRNVSRPIAWIISGSVVVFFLLFAMLFTSLTGAVSGISNAAIGAAAAASRCSGQFQGASGDVTIGQWDASKSSASYNSKYIYLALRSGGWTPAAAAGALGNFEKESNFDPWILENSVPAYGRDKPPQEMKGCPQPGAGIAQWGWSNGNCGGSTRFNALITEAQKRGADPWNLQTQVEYIFTEIKKHDTYSSLRNFVTKVDDPVVAAVKFHQVYEGSADSESAIINGRGGAAKKWFDKYKDLTVPDASAGGGASTSATGPVFVVGDSLTVGSQSAIKKQYKQKGVAVTVDAKTSRSTAAGINILKSSKKAKAANTWVVALGTNDGGPEAAYRKNINKVMKLAGGKQVFWGTVYRPGVAEPINAAITAAASKYPNLSTIDFQGMVNADKNLLASDGIHLTPGGYDTRAAKYVVVSGNTGYAAAPKRGTFEVAGQLSNGVVPPVRMTNGKYTGPTYYPIRSAWSMINSHDISPVAVGTPLYAIRDGVVTASYDIKGYEGDPRILTQNGYRSYGRVIMVKFAGVSQPMTFAHLQKRFVKKGQRVVAGQIIGLTGLTGKTTGPHLHVDFNNVNTAAAWVKNNATSKPPTSNIPEGNGISDGGGMSDPDLAGATGDGIGDECDESGVGDEYLGEILSLDLNTELPAGWKEFIPDGGASKLHPDTLRAAQYAKAVWGKAIYAIGGWRANGGGVDDHPTGRAIDMMITNYKSSKGRATGNQIAEFFAKNAKQFGVEYVVFDKKIMNTIRDNPNEPISKWRGMSERGNDTDNHMDHVHVSFWASKTPSKNAPAKLWVGK